MRIQDKYYELDKVITSLLLSGKYPEQIVEYWGDLAKWLDSKKFFGEWGYDPINKCFKVEPDLPGQQKLFEE